MTHSSDSNHQFTQTTRSSSGNVKLVLKAVGGNLLVASILTLSLMGGMVFALMTGLVFIQNSENPNQGLVIAIALTLLF